MELTKRQKIEQEYYNNIVHKTWDGKDLFVEKETPPFGKFSGDLFDGAKKYLENIENKKILEVACGNGELSVWFAKNKAKIYGIDLSNESIEVCKKRSEFNETQNLTTFSVSPAEKTNFQDKFFDIIYINVSLHHFEIEKALKEFKRILKSGGTLIAVEPLAFSNVIQKVRESKIFTKFYPIRKETPTERILLKKDLETVRNIFGNIKYKPYRIISPFIFKIKPLFNFLSNTIYKKEKEKNKRQQKFNRSVQKFDEFILKIPLMKTFSRYVIFKTIKK